MRSCPRVVLVSVLVTSGCSSPTGSSSSSSSKPSKTVTAPAGPVPTASGRESGLGSAAPTSSVGVGAPSASAVTLTYNPDGPNDIDDAKLHGDPATCAKVKACCNGQSGPLALGCQMAVSQESGNCAAILATVQPLASELGKPPPGCK
ncbi:MAG: hypothetical protein U0414_18950 [Polyangiaceae bacterium]